ncbi:MAG: hypothetical protein ABGZ53_19190 [Fuerstiella sp.]
MNDVLQSILESAGIRHQQDGAKQEFLPVLLQQAATDLRLSGIALWTSGGNGATLLAQLGDDNYAELSTDDVCSAPIGEVCITKSNPASTNGGRRLLTASVLAGQHRLILCATEGQPATEHGLFVRLADVFADLQRRRILDRHFQHSEQDRKLNAVIAQLHTSLSSDVVANILATDGSAALDCSRLAVARRDARRRWDVVATTGVSRPNLRSDAIRQICSQIDEVEAGNPGDAGPTIVQPLVASNSWNDATWACVVHAGEPFADHDRSRVERLCHHASMALSNCETLQQSTLIGQLRRGLKGLTRPAWTVFFVAFAAFCLIPSELRIEVYGELVPTQRAFVFAPDDGTITDVSIDDGSHVASGKTLCVLKNEDLEVQLQSIDGEFAAVSARIAAIDAMRGNRTSNNDSLMSAEQVELKQRIASLAMQSKIVMERIEQLNVVSRIDGRVYGDRLKQLLTQRPVQRGQFLFEIANPAADWQLDLRVLEADARHVLAAMGANDANLSVTFALETSPETLRETQLESLAASTDIDERGTLSTLAIARVGNAGFQNERPGTGVIAYIHCGKRATAYVWFRKVIDFVQRYTWL